MLGCEDVVSVFVIVRVSVPVSPGAVGSMTVVCSPASGCIDDNAAAKLSLKAPKSPRRPSEVSEGVSEDVDDTTGVVVLAY